MADTLRLHITQEKSVAFSIPALPHRTNRWRHFVEKSKKKTERETNKEKKEGKEKGEKKVKEEKRKYTVSPFYKIKNFLNKQKNKKQNIIFVVFSAFQQSYQ